MLEQKPNSEQKDETLDSSSPNSINTNVVGSQCHGTVSFEELKSIVNHLQNEFNSKLLSALNSCNEPVICPIVSTSSYAQEINKCRGISKETPIYLNLIKKSSIGMCAEYIYGSNLVM